jgi:hypothetical protein
MSKFWFFERKGRPTANESRVCDKITSALNRGMFEKEDLDEYVSNYGKAFSEEDLTEMYEYLSGEDLQGNKIENYEDDDYDEDNDGIEDAVEDYIDDTNGNKVENPINFNPFEEPVIERSYTQGFVNDQKDEQVFDDDDMKMPTDGDSINDIPDEEQDIPEPEYANTHYPQDEDDEDYDDEDYDDEDGDGKLGGDNLKDLTPAQKRKSAEKTAEALLKLYCQFSPLPFKSWASFKDSKIQKMAFEDKLDLQMPLENGITVQDYIDGQNEQVEEIFKVTEEQREEIKDPLIDVLLEQELAFTPTQRLMLAVGSHLVTMSFSAYQLSQNNKVALETFERYHQTTKKQSTNVPFPNEQAVKSKAKKKDNLSKVEQEAVEKFMREMSGDDDEEIIDAEHDPTIEVTEDYDDN